MGKEEKYKEYMKRYACFDEKEDTRVTFENIWKKFFVSAGTRHEISAEAIRSDKGHDIKEHIIKRNEHEIGFEIAKYLKDKGQVKVSIEDADDDPWPRGFGHKIFRTSAVFCDLSPAEFHLLIKAALESRTHREEVVELLKSRGI